MRPDQHKQRTSRRYQSKHKATGDTTSADVAQSRRRNARGRGRGGSGVGVRRKEGGEAEEKEGGEDEDEDEDEESAPSPAARRSGAGFSRRKVISNAHRYEEPSAEDELAAEAELGIDRQMVDFIELLKSGGDETETAYDPSTYFQFKEEKDWDDGLGGMEGGGADELYASLMQIRFDDLETSLAKVPLHVRLGLDERDLAMVTDDFYSDNNLLSAPIVPKFVRSEALLVKKAGDGGAAGSATTSSANPSPADKTVTSAPGPPTRVLRIVSAGGRATTTTKDADDDLDELLALGDDKPTVSPASSSREPPTSNATRSKPSATAQKAKSRGTDANDFDQFMDEIDGKGGAKTSSAKPASSAAPPRKLQPLARPTPREGHVGPGAIAAAAPPPKGGKGGDGMEDWLDDVLGDA